MEEYMFSIHDDDRQLVVGITRNGRVDIGPGASGVDAAAMAFYQAVSEIIERLDSGEDLEQAKPEVKPS